MAEQAINHQILALNPIGDGIRVNLRYSTADPFAVVMELRNRDTGWVAWAMSRELLTDGMTRPSGTGDVEVIPDGETVVIWFHSAHGGLSAPVTFSRADLQRLLDDAEALVPRGTEEIDWDTEMTLLGGGQR